MGESRARCQGSGLAVPTALVSELTDAPVAVSGPEFVETGSIGLVEGERGSRIATSRGRANWKAASRLLELLRHGLMTATGLSSAVWSGPELVICTFLILLAATERNPLLADCDWRQAPAAALPWGKTTNSTRTEILSA